MQTILYQLVPPQPPDVWKDRADKWGKPTDFAMVIIAIVALLVAYRQLRGIKLASEDAAKAQKLQLYAVLAELDKQATDQLKIKNENLSGLNELKIQFPGDEETLEVLEARKKYSRSAGDFLNTMDRTALVLMTMGDLIDFIHEYGDAMKQAHKISMEIKPENNPWTNIRKIIDSPVIKHPEKTFSVSIGRFNIAIKY